MKTHYQILIVGGGNAGISIAAQLTKRRKDLDIVIVDPADKHYYSPHGHLLVAGLSILRIQSEI